MGGGTQGEKDKQAPPPDGPEGHNGLEDAAEEATRALEKQRDGKGYAGFGDIG
ncbi:MAG TPA: hypothetical protein VGF77_07720 [Allosphingosinicella sp.]|jgi:hypothetical protein